MLHVVAKCNASLSKISPLVIFIRTWLIIAHFNYFRFSHDTFTVRDCLNIFSVSVLPLEYLLKVRSFEFKVLENEFLQKRVIWPLSLHLWHLAFLRNIFVKYALSKCVHFMTCLSVNSVNWKGTGGKFKTSKFVIINFKTSKLQGYIFRKRPLQWAAPWYARSDA